MGYSAARSGFCSFFAHPFWLLSCLTLFLGQGFGVASSLQAAESELPRNATRLEDRQCQYVNVSSSLGPAGSGMPVGVMWLKEAATQVFRRQA